MHAFSSCLFVALASVKTGQAAQECHYLRGGASCYEERRQKCESGPVFDWQRGSCPDTGYSNCCKYDAGGGILYNLWYKAATKSCPIDEQMELPSLGPCNTQQVAVNSNIETLPPAQVMKADVKTGPKPIESIAQSEGEGYSAGICHYVRSGGASCFEERRQKCESGSEFDWQRGSCADTAYSNCCKYDAGGGDWYPNYYRLWYKAATKSCPIDEQLEIPSLGPCNTQQVAVV